MQAVEAVPQDVSVAADLSTLTQLIPGRTVYWIGHAGEPAPDYVVIDKRGRRGEVTRRKTPHSMLLTATGTPMRKWVPTVLLRSCVKYLRRTHPTALRAAFRKRAVVWGNSLAHPCFHDLKGLFCLEPAVKNRGLRASGALPHQSRVHL